MNKYARCVNNKVYFKGDWGDTYYPDLVIGKVYRVAPPLYNDDPSMIRIFDGSYGQAGSEIGYLYPRDYFEVLDFETRNGHATRSITVHLTEEEAGILHAEAIMAEKSISSLVREWIDERLDLPEPMVS